MEKNSFYSKTKSNKPNKSKWAHQKNTWTTKPFFSNKSYSDQFLQRRIISLGKLCTLSKHPRSLLIQYEFNIFFLLNSLFLAIFLSFRSTLVSTCMSLMSNFLNISEWDWISSFEFADCSYMYLRLSLILSVLITLLPVSFSILSWLLRATYNFWSYC